jgi:phosphoglycerol transferase MdoB-like AlkP superfamily enzyme
VVEIFFFDEFNARFNFIAVDYLIYPHEVFVNIWDSYPVGRVLIGVFVLALFVHTRLRRPLVLAHQQPSGYRQRLAPFAVFVGALSLAFGAVDMSLARYSNNHVANELAANGIYSFFYAAANNELDYDRYYLTLDRDEAVARLRKLVSQPNATFLPDAANPIARHINNRGPAKKLNVVVLVEESLGADFVGAYGDRRGLTPTLDGLAKDSMMFTNMYATGTRTVRGLEAISSSFPPIPGESIVKRPRNENLFNWGQVMRQNGYAPTFIYGGYGTFDNMNYFFGHNGFDIVDRLQIEQPKFGNIWGVSDEDLFAKAIEVFDRQHAKGETIFSMVMTTSNHKPYTFPEGVPGIQPSGGGRDMGVKYADYALGRFFAAVRTKPYFDDTLFVVVGDHGARVYGREDIPMRSYELPLLVYAPKHVAAGKVDILGSQIDIAPTILGLLGISYDTVFFGRDMFQGDAAEKFALLSHDRDVALYQHGKLVELGIKQASLTLQYDKRSNQQSPVEPDPEAVKNAVAIFENGYDFYQRGLYRLN